MRYLLYSWKVSMRSFIVFFFSSFSFFFFFFSFSLKKRFLSLSEESLLFHTFFGKAIREKMFLLIVKNKKFFFFFNVLVLRILSSIIEYCKLETPENTDYCICQVTYQYWMKRHSEIAWTSRNSVRETSIITDVSDWDGIHSPNIVFDIYPNFTKYRYVTWQIHHLNKPGR